MKAKLFILLFFLAGIICRSQAQSCQYQLPLPMNLPIPDMYVEKTIGQAIENQFVAKHDTILLKKGIQVNDQILFTRNAFINMIKHFCIDLKFDTLRVYFAQYPGVADNFTPKGWENKLNLLFKPVANGSPDLGFYTISDHAANYVKLDPGVGDKWINIYSTSILPVLINTLSENDKDNFDPSSKTYSDTRFVSYCAQDWIQLLKEIDYQDNNVYNVPNYVSGVKAIFSAYGSDGDGETISRFRFRLIPQFEFTTNKGGVDTVFYIDDQKDFSTIRQPQQFACGGKSTGFQHTFGMALDNGHLCPPICEN